MSSSADRNTNCIHLHPEAAETVRLIYDYYLQGIGQKEIARRLNRLGRKTPAQLRAERYGREFYAARKDRSGQYVWTYVSVKNVLTEEGYTGVLINHRTETRHGKAPRFLPTSGSGTRTSIRRLSQRKSGKKHRYC